MSAALPQPIQQMIDATRVGDDDSFLSCFTEDAYLQDWGRVFRGRSGVARWNDSDNIGQANRFAVTHAAEHDGTWTLHFDAHSRRRSGPGTLLITLTAGRISRFIVS